MVRAILDGRKTQTRRIIKPQLDYPILIATDPNPRFGWRCETYAPSHFAKLCDKGTVGDRLWVRENGWERPIRTPNMMREGADTWESYYYDADGLTESDTYDFKKWGFKRRPSIRMPRWASRLTLEITDVRVQRIQQITAKEIIAEGAVLRAHDSDFGHNPVSAFDKRVYLDLQSLWVSGWVKLNGKGSWAANPWVWVIEFERVG